MIRDLSSIQNGYKKCTCQISYSNSLHAVATFYRLFSLTSSMEDMLDVFSCAMKTKVKYCVVNAMSDNPGMVWDIETTKKLIGYNPKSKGFSSE